MRGGVYFSRNCQKALRLSHDRDDGATPPSGPARRGQRCVMMTTFSYPRDSPSPLNRWFHSLSGTHYATVVLPFGGVNILMPVGRHQAWMMFGGVSCNLAPPRIYRTIVTWPEYIGPLNFVRNETLRPEAEYVHILFMKTGSKICCHWIRLVLQ